MDDKKKDREVKKRSPRAPRRVADWVSTSMLEDELFNAIQMDASWSDDEQMEADEIDDFITWEEDDADEQEERRSLYNLLAELRPLTAELLARS